MKSALSIMFGVAAVALVAAPLTSYAGGTIAGKVTYAGKAEGLVAISATVSQR